VSGDERVELRQDVGVAPDPEIGVDAILDRPEAYLLEPCDLGARELVVRELRQSLPAPERQRLAEPQTGRPRVALECRAGVGSEALETARVELAVVEPQHVPRRMGDDRPSELGTECPTKLGDEVLERLRGGRRRIPGPELVDQPVAGDDLAAVQHEEHQERPLSPSAELDPPAVRPDLERPEDPYVHPPPFPIADSPAAFSVTGGHVSIAALARLRRPLEAAP
jgi:hypothetical protein